MVVITRHKYATAHSNAAYLRQIGVSFDLERTFTLLSLTRFLVFNNFVSAITGVSAIFFDFSKKFVGGTGFF